MTINYERNKPHKNSPPCPCQQQVARIPDDARHHHRRSLRNYDAGHRARFQTEHTGPNQRDGFQYDYDTSRRRRPRRCPSGCLRHGDAEAGRLPEYRRRNPLCLCRFTVGQQQRTSHLRRQQRPDHRLRYQPGLSGNPPLQGRRR